MEEAKKQNNSYKILERKYQNGKTKFFIEITDNSFSTDFGIFPRL